MRVVNENMLGSPLDRDEIAGPRRIARLKRPIPAPYVWTAYIAAGALGVLGIAWAVYGLLPGAPHAFPYIASALGEAAAYAAITCICVVSNLTRIAEDGPRAGRVLIAWSAAVAVVLFGMHLAGGTDGSYRRWLAAVFCGGAAGVLTCELVLAQMARRWRRVGRLAETVVLIGSGADAVRTLGAIERSARADFLVLGYFDDRRDRAPSHLGELENLGSVDDLLAFVQRRRVDHIVVALPWTAADRTLHFVRRLRHLAVNVQLAPELDGTRFPGAHRGSLGTLATLCLRQKGLSDGDLFAKAIMDRALAALLLIALVMPLAAIAIAVALESRGPVLFRQKRLGFNHRPFDVLKFRTMRHRPAADDDLRQATRGDPRMTRIGPFLRRTSLDELPQLVNVLRGDMSLVGPRPHPIWRTAGELWESARGQAMEDVIAEYAARHRVKPGITGWAQVWGHRGETETPDKMRQRVRYDLDYIERWSLWLDLRILVMTVATVLGRRNAH